MFSIIDVPTEVLENELKRRMLLKKIEGEIFIKSGQVSFTINTLPWPDGSYKILIDCIQDLTSSDKESEINNESKK